MDINVINIHHTLYGVRRVLKDELTKLLTTYPFNLMGWLHTIMFPQAEVVL